MEEMVELSVQDREQALVNLKRRLRKQDIRAVMDSLSVFGKKRKRRSVEWIVADTESSGGRLRSRLTDDELYGFLIDLLSYDLLSSPELRLRLARASSESELHELHDYEATSLRGRGGRESTAKAVAQRNWHPGKGWASHFARALGFSPKFAGASGSQSGPPFEEVEPFRPLPELTDFQRDLKLKVIRTLEGLPGENRGILTLPTGAGKTRTAIEALVEWKATRQSSALILWIAQSDELCEQAFQSFREVWIDQGHRDKPQRQSLLMHRLWGPKQPAPTSSDVVVASIQKLHAVYRGEDDDSRQRDLLTMLSALGVVVVDEAHRLLAPSYSDVLGLAGLNIRGHSAVPLLGLTATPYRGQGDETRRLAERFHGRLLSPTGLGQDMVTTLRDRGVLSLPKHKVISYRGRTYSMDADPRYSEHFRKYGDLHPDILSEIGEEGKRNRQIRDLILDMPADWPVLFFGCSVQHAAAMSVLLRRAGRPSAMVTAETRPATRRHLIEEFRNGCLSVLCNYGVLTTGFDAPKVRSVVVARPTVSPVLYEQMIGRGMRGAAFGGTEECLVIDIEDNIEFAGQMAYTRYNDYWVHG